MDASRSWQRVELQISVELGALLVERIVIAVDIAEITGGTNHVTLGAAFAAQQTGDIGEGASHLSSKVPNVQALPLLVD